MRKLKAKFKRTKLIFRAWREYKRRKISYALFCLISRQNIDKTRFHFLKQILNQLSNAGFKALPATRKEARLLAKCDKNSTNSSKFMQENSVEFVDFKQGIPKNFSKSISSNPSEITLKSDKITINLDTNYPWIAIEVFVTQIYALPKMISKLLFGEKAEPKRYIVLDFGANRGYASLYFATQTWCEKIYAFELFPQTFTQACENIALNPALAPKITLFNYGLGNLDSAPLDIRQAANERERERERRHGAWDKMGDRSTLFATPRRHKLDECGLFGELCTGRKRKFNKNYLPNSPSQ